MPALAFALSLLLADTPAAAEAAAPPAPAPAAEAPAAASQEAPWPTGAPKGDYQLVAWCYGALRGYLDLHDEVMPEVTRIESEFRRPGSKLADDLKVYADQQKQAKLDLKRFQRALTAAEKASARPINTVGAAAVQKGHAIWTVTPGTPKARVAQEWMSWTLPSRCSATADSLEKRAVLMGPAFKANVEDEEAATPAAPASEPPAAEAPAPEAPVPEAPVADKPADPAPAAEKPGA